MNSRATANLFAPKPVVAAVALALAAPVAFADNGMPGAGLVVRNQGNVTVNATPLPGGNQIIGLTTGATIQNTNAAASSTVIQWGSPGVVDSANKGGFNVAAKNVLNFTSAAAGSGFLNIDISGNLSTIAGKVTADGNSVLAIANAKGITIASGATIVAPVGFAAIGTNMNTIDAINSWDPTAGATGKMNFAAGAPVTVQGDLSGVATYLVVAGSDSVNLSPSKQPAAAVPISVDGGVGASYNVLTGAVTLSDKGAADQTTVFQSQTKSNVTIGLGSAKLAQDGTKLWVWANGDLTNTGVVDFGAAGPSATNNFQWTGTLTNSGTLETTTAATDLNFDVNGSVVSWWNNSSKTQPTFGGFNNSGTMQAVDGDLAVEANQGDVTNSGTMLAGNGDLTVGSNNGAVTNSGTMQAKGGTGGSGSVYIYADSTDATGTSHSSNPHDVTNSGTIMADYYVNIYSQYGNVTNTKTGLISAVTTLAAEANAGTSGTFGSFTNQGTLQITGPNGSIFVGTNGAGDVNVGGAVQASGAGATIGYFSAWHASGDGGTRAKGTTTVSTPINVVHDYRGSILIDGGGDTNISSSGIYLSGMKINVSAPLTVTEATTGAGAGSIYFWGTSNNTRNSVTLAAGANLTAGSVGSAVTNSGGNFTFSPFSQDWMVNANITTTKSGSAGGPQAIALNDVGNLNGPGTMTANQFLFAGYGNFNNPTSTTNWLMNGLNLVTTGSDPTVTIEAKGPGIQAINLRINGDATVTSGQTVADTINPGNIFGYGCFNTPLCNYTPEPNAGSSLLVQATGNLTIGPGNYANALQQNYTPSGVGNSTGFLFPGALAFVAGGTLNVNTTVDNAYGGTVLPFQGQWYQGTAINDTQPLYTNGNARINFSIHPNGSPILPAVFTSTVTNDLFGFSHLVPTLNPNATFLNTYTVIVQAFAAGQDWLSLISNTPIH